MKINQEIKNPYCEVEENSRLNARDYLNSVLILEEKLADDYSKFFLSCLKMLKMLIEK